MACCSSKLSEAQPVGPARVSRPHEIGTSAFVGKTAPLQDGLEGTAQGFMPEHESAAQRLVRDDALASQQKLVGEIAGHVMQQRSWNAKHRRSMKPSAKLLGDFHISDPGQEYEILRGALPKA